MTTNDQLDAIKALTYRLTEWGVDAPAVKAEQYVNDLVGRGWAMSANVRPIRRPPQKHEECATHVGEYRDMCRGCIADRKARTDDEPHGTRAGWDVARVRAEIKGGATEEKA